MRSVATSRRPASAVSARIHLLVQQLGLADAIDRDLHLLKVHLPYHEWDHVLNLAYNIFAAALASRIWNCCRNDERI